MADKTIILLLVLFTAVGVVFYDRHAVQNGKLSPIGQLVDFAGLSKEELQKKNEEDLIIERKKRTFKFQSGEALQRLQEKYKKIEAQRVKLVENRQEILQNLMILIQDTEDDAVKYTQVIHQEKERLNQQFPKFNQWRKDLVDLQEETDPVLRDQKYQVLKIELLSSLEEKAAQSKLKLMLENLQKIIDRKENGSVEIEDCGNLEYCIDQYVNDIENNLNEIVNPINDKKDLMGLIKKIKTQYQYQMDQSYVQESDFEKSHERVDSKIKHMVEQLVKVTENDLKDLIFLYQELEVEQRMLAEDMEAEQNYWQYQHKQSMRKMKEKIVRLKKNFKQASRQLKEKNRDLEYKRKNMAEQAKYNADNMKRVMKERFAANRNFLEKVAGMIDIDIKRLVADQEYAIKKNATYLRDRRAVQDQLMEKSKDEIDQKKMGGLGTEIKSGLTQSPELRQTDRIRTLNRFGLEN